MFYTLVHISYPVSLAIPSSISPCFIPSSIMFHTWFCFSSWHMDLALAFFPNIDVYHLKKYRQCLSTEASRAKKPSPPPPLRNSTLLVSDACATCKPRSITFSHPTTRCIPRESKVIEVREGLRRMS